MPIYTYRCNSCKKLIERLHGVKKKVIMICPSCGGQMQKTVSLPSKPKFKGTGFYETDYKDKK